jgi:hypothetical protein
MFWRINFPDYFNFDSFLISQFLRTLIDFNYFYILGANLFKSKFSFIFIFSKKKKDIIL